MVRFRVRVVVVCRNRVERERERERTEKLQRGLSGQGADTGVSGFVGQWADVRLMQAHVRLTCEADTVAPLPR